MQFVEALATLDMVEQAIAYASLWDLPVRRPDLDRLAEKERQQRRRHTYKCAPAAALRALGSCTNCFMLAGLVGEWI